MSIIEYGEGYRVGTVKDAANWMDENFPGWEKQIDADTLDMSFHELCIGGQMGIDWDLRLNLPYKRDRGLTSTGAVFASHDEEWKSEIDARLARA